MALTQSGMVNIGAIMPDFTLENTLSENRFFSSEMKNKKAYVVFFICNHCPYVLHINEQLNKLVAEFQSQNIEFIGISSNDPLEYPEDGPENMKIHGEKMKYHFPYLYDQSQEIAKAFGAECTPDFFVYSAEKKLVYRGRMDESSPKNGKTASGCDLRGALNAILKNQMISEIQFPSMGCGIKWKK